MGADDRGRVRAAVVTEHGHPFLPGRALRIGEPAVRTPSSVQTREGASHRHTRAGAALTLADRVWLGFPVSLPIQCPPPSVPGERTCRAMTGWRSAKARMRCPCEPPSPLALSPSPIPGTRDSQAPLLSQPRPRSSPLRGALTQTCSWGPGSEGR